MVEETLLGLSWTPNDWFLLVETGTAKPPSKPPATRASVATSSGAQPAVFVSKDGLAIAFAPLPTGATTSDLVVLAWPPSTSVTVTVQVQVPAA